MGSSEPTCKECGAALHLLQSACEACHTQYDWSFLAECSQCGRETEYLETCSCGATQSPWRAVELVALEDGSVTVDKDAIERPIAAGYSRHVGTIRGQWADYRRATEKGEFHIRVYLDHYELHVDEVSALYDPAKHSIRYGPKAAVTTTADVFRTVRGAVGRAGGWVRSAFGTSSSDLVSEKR